MEIEELGNLTLVRCKTCGKTLGNLYNRFIKLRDQEALAASDSTDLTTPAERAFKKLGIMKECCRFNLNNPPRIPIGGYFFKPENVAPNTYIMGEYGKNYGDPRVLDDLNASVTEESKRSLIMSGTAPVYKRVVSAGSQRYGNRFQPTLQELMSYVIKEYVNLNNQEAEEFRKALWHLFLFSMYARGWKGPDYTYPIKSLGIPDIETMKQQIIAILEGSTEYQPLRSNLRLLYAYVEGRTSLPDWPETLTHEYLTTIYDIIGNLTMPPYEVATPNHAKMQEEMELFIRHVTYSQGTLKCYRMINSINVIDGTPTKQSISLHHRVTGITGNNQPIDDQVIPRQDPFNLARVIAITCYYMLNLITGNKIANFSPKDITSMDLGVTFLHAPSGFVAFIE